MGLELSGWGTLPLVGCSPGLSWTMKEKEADLTVRYILVGDSLT